MAKFIDAIQEIANDLLRGNTIKIPQQDSIENAEGNEQFKTK